MTADLSCVELGFVLNIETLRTVLKTLSINGKRWWVASDPQDAVANGYVSIGHGDPCCEDRLNTLYFRIPVLNSEVPAAGTARLLLLLDPFTCCPEEPGYYLENGRVVQASLEDFMSFYLPIKDALTAQLQAGDQPTKAEQ